MNPLRTLYLFFLNGVMALGVLFGVLCVGEYLISGFATPFIDVVHLGLLVLALSVIATLLRPSGMEEPGLATRIWQAIVILIAFVVGGYVLWANGQAGSTSDLMILVVYGALSLSFLVVTLKTL